MLAFDMGASAFSRKWGRSTSWHWCFCSFSELCRASFWFTVLPGRCFIFTGIKPSSPHSGVPGACITVHWDATASALNHCKGMNEACKALMSCCRCKTCLKIFTLYTAFVSLQDKSLSSVNDRL